MVLVIGLAFSAYLGFSAHNTDKRNLITRTSTIAQLVTAKDIEDLKGSKDDLTNPSYMRIKERLMSIRAVNPDVRFIYINGMRSGKVFFFADSEDPGSYFYSPPGQDYEEASESMKKLFDTKSDGFEVAGDRWGIWASALVPIIDPASGKAVALMGMDMPAQRYIMDILIYSFFSLIFTAFIIALLLVQKRRIDSMQKAHESLAARNFELAHMNKIIEERKKEAADLKKELDQMKKMMEKSKSH